MIKKRQLRRMRGMLVAALAGLAAPLVLAGAPRDAWAQKSGGHEDIALAIGETRTLSAVGIREYSEGVKGIVDVVPTPDGRTFILTGKKEGTTTLLLINNSGGQTTYEINVAKRNVGLVEREVQELIKDISGPKTRRIGARVFIDGSVATPAEKARVDQIAGLYGEQVQSIVTVGRFEERMHRRPPATTPASGGRRASAASSSTATSPSSRTATPSTSSRARRRRRRRRSSTSRCHGSTSRPAAAG